MKILLTILALFLFSCESQRQRVGTSPKGKTSDFAVETSRVYRTIIDISSAEIDSMAQIKIISQIPVKNFNLYDENDLIDLKITQTSPRTLLVEVPSDFFFNSVRTASEISDFSRENPASARGIFGNLMGITELAQGTQRVIFGILPRTAKSIEFRFETDVSDTVQIINSLIWKYNSNFNITHSENKVSMDRRSGGLSAAEQITLQNIVEENPLKMLAEDNNLSAFLFKKSDLAHLERRMRGFTASTFDNFIVSAFLNPEFDENVKNALTTLLKSADFANNLDYDLSVFADEIQAEIDAFDKDSIVIIYDKNNLIALETAMFLGNFLEKNTSKKIIVRADEEHRNLFFFDYDIVITANSASLNETFLSRKYSDSRVDLFEMKIYLVSAQKIAASGNAVSRLGVAK